MHGSRHRQLYGAFERPGVYLLAVEKPGFMTWRREDVRVEEDVCHVITESFETRLSSEPE